MNMEKKKQARSSLLLTLTALIWGVAFVAQSAGMNYVGGFTFNGCRFLIGGIVLLPCIFFMRKTETGKMEIGKPEDGKQQAQAGRKLEQQVRDGHKTEQQRRDGHKTEQRETDGRNAEQKRLRTGIIGGICCGTLLCLASSFQQFGIAYTTVGKAGFITALYIVIVPLFGLFLKKKVGINIWISVAIAAVGMYLLCITEDFSIGRGDFLVFLCALGFSVHILVIDYFSPRADGVVISCVQFFTAGVISCVMMLLFEHPTWTAVFAAAAPILYAGVMSCGVGYTLQVVAQKDIDPTIASLLMSLESVFSLLAGWIILGQKLSGKELMGCVLVFAAILLAQIPVGQLMKAKRVIPEE